MGPTIMGTDTAVAGMMATTTTMATMAIDTMAITAMDTVTGRIAMVTVTTAIGTATMAIGTTMIIMMITVTEIDMVDMAMIATMMVGIPAMDMEDHGKEILDGGVIILT